jgi:hypothetical protein
MVSIVAERTEQLHVSAPTRAAEVTAPSWTSVRQFDFASSWRHGNVSFVISMVFHLGLMIALGLIPLPNRPFPNLVTLTAADVEEWEPFELAQELTVAEEPDLDIGNEGVDGSEATLSTAPEVADLIVFEDVESPMGDVELNRAFDLTMGLHYNENLPVLGTVSEGVSATEGAIDRLTQEIMLSVQERKTTVVWLFDQSASLLGQRQEIYNRVDQVYEELGVIEAASHPAFDKHENKPLLTSMYAYGAKIHRLLDKPTDNVQEIKHLIAEIPLDPSGIELTFTAVQQAVKDSARMRARNLETGEPDRNVMVVVFTDEVGDDQEKLDETIKLCRRYGIPVYVVGVPAPFGRKTAYVKWIDPDPEYDQTPQWGEVDQGPESVTSEHLKLTFGTNREMEEPLDSGFGPYALTRLCYETGGIFFSVHPNRDTQRAVSRGQTAESAAHLRHFFDPDVMRRYRPDYIPLAEYRKLVLASKARMALVNAAQLSWVHPMESPTLRFVKRDEASFVNALTEAQKVAARIEPNLRQLYEILQQGEVDRGKETSPRWKAGFDLAIGRVMAVKVRTEGYNAMLAMAKRGMRFEDAKNNTWILEPSDEILIGSQAEKLAERAREYLEVVVEQHAGTPWALLAEKELASPIGWRWKEEFTDLAPPRRAGAGNAGTPAPGRDDRPRMLTPPKPKRPPPKL